MKISRRELLRAAGTFAAAEAAAAALGAAGMLFGTPVWEKGWNTLGRTELLKSIAEIELHLLKRYKITVDIEPAQKAVRGVFQKDPEDKDVLYSSLDKKGLYVAWRTLENVRNGLALYPPSEIGKYVKKIHIVERTWVGLSEAGGATDTSRSPSLMWLAMVPEKGIVLTRDAVLGEHALIPHTTIHHEINHALMDVAGAVGEWEHIAPQSKYLGENWAQARLKDIRGFARDYGTSNESEDMATIAEFLYMPDEGEDYEFSSFYADQKKRGYDAFSDAIVQKKMAFLKQKYHELLGVDDGYWEDVKRGNVDEAYWDTKKLSFPSQGGTF